MEATIKTETVIEFFDNGYTWKSKNLEGVYDDVNLVIEGEDKKVQEVIGREILSDIKYVMNTSISNKIKITMQIEGL